MSAPRIVADLRRKLAAVSDVAEDIALAVCAREEVKHLPEGVQAITAAEIFSPD